MTLDPYGQQLFIASGHDGDCTTFYPVPISIPAKDATDNFKVLDVDSSSNPDDPSALHA
jgi:hypothetical protein